MKQQFSMEQALRLHEIIVRETGGDMEIRDRGLLDSALQGAYATFGGEELYPGRLAKAARLGFSLISNHAFVDGNKRIGIFIMLTFLELHGVRMSCTNDDVIEAGLSVAAGKWSYEDLLKWVERFAS